MRSGPVWGQSFTYDLRVLFRISDRVGKRGTGRIGVQSAGKRGWNRQRGWKSWGIGNQTGAAFTPIRELADHNEAAAVAAPFRQDGFGRRRFDNAGQGCVRLGEKLFAY